MYVKIIHASFTIMNKFVLRITKSGLRIKLLLALCIFSNSIYSQGFTNGEAREFKAYKCELGSYFGLAMLNAYNFGFGGYLHPSYYMNDYVNVGFRGEAAIVNLDNSEQVISSLTSFQLTASCYITKSRFRPYYSTCTGLYVFGIDKEKEYRFGIVPKIGFDMGPVTMYVSYNYIFGPEHGEESRNHLDMGKIVFLNAI